MLYLGVSLAVMFAAVSGGPDEGRDRNIRPPEERVFTSPAGKFRLVVRARHSGWKGADANATLYGLEGGSPREIWTRELPHRYGPRFALVDSSGNVAFFDEWFNTPSEHALTVIAADNRRIAQYSFREIADVLQVAGEALVRSATKGPWMSGEPRFSPSGEHADVPAGGRTLRLNMQSGDIRAL